MLNVPRWRPVLLGGLLFVATLAAFAPALRNGFVDYDDRVFTVDNPQVNQGISLAAVRWAFTTRYFANWQPLTWRASCV